MIQPKVFISGGGLLLLSTMVMAQTRTPDPIFKNSSEAGVIITSGNTRARSYNVKQLNTYDFGDNTLKFTAQYLRLETFGAETARWWNAGLRYQRHFTPANIGLYLGESIESNRYSGFDYRYHSDAGVVFTVLKTDDFWWTLEGGYRYTIEDPTLGGSNRKSHYGRAYTEIFKDWTPTLSVTAWVEYLPNFSTQSHWQLNTEAGVNVALSEIFSMKVGYLYKFNNEPAPATEKGDSFFTTSLVAKF